MAKKSYEENGIKLSKKTIYSGDKIQLSYTGLLANSGAQSVILHYGFGEQWENSSFIPMSCEDGAFCAEVELADSSCFGVCFKDSAENWDNNSGQNYVYTISKKPVKKANSETAEKPAKTATKTTKAKK